VRREDEARGPPRQDRLAQAEVQDGEGRTVQQDHPDGMPRGVRGQWYRDIDACRGTRGDNQGRRGIMLPSFGNEDDVYELNMARGSSYQLKRIDKGAQVEDDIYRTEARALVTPSGTSRMASTWYASSTFQFDLNVVDGASHDPIAVIGDAEEQHLSHDVHRAPREEPRLD